ncbi:iron ABC transporter permease [Hazenella sp. IB182357]|uniref:Iron ABC transporter permease n=1 Tax=Polycladospora coralii TaxID=2771432 RepID=A0A926RVV3_9BACL|nr:iron ABC transporter permease [Polycladospora coralii]
MKRTYLVGGGLLIVLLFSISFTVSSGSADVAFHTVWQVIGFEIWGDVRTDIEVDEAISAIIWQIRLPRVLLAALVGASLALAGVIYQGLLKNPLADPFVLGVSSGAALGAAIAIWIGWGINWLGQWHVPTYAFVGACLALLMVLKLGQGPYIKSESFILAGVVIQAFLGAVLTFVLSITPENLFRRIQFWLMGSLSFRNWEHLFVLSIVLCIGFIVALIYSRELNLFLLGTRSAAHLGVSVNMIYWGLLLLASVITGAAVAVSGTIGFVGLAIPHMIRLVTGADHRKLIPLATLSGAIFLVWCDYIARTVLSPIEIPLGVITAFFGAPFFAFLLKKRQDRLSA